MAENNPYVEIAITNSAGTPTVVRNEIMRSDTGAAGSFVRIASNVAPNSLYRDFQVARGRTYFYQVRAISSSGAVSTSATASLAVTWTDYDWLCETDGSNPAKFRWNPSPVLKIDVQGSFIEFDGRALPLAFSGEGTNESWALQYTENIHLDTLDQWVALRYLVDTRRGRDLLWRDKLGNLLYVRALSIERTPGKPGPRSSVAFTLRRVDHAIAV